MRITRIAAPVMLALVLSVSLPARGAGGDEGWRTTFEDTCARSNDAMSLSVTELKALVETCDRLRKSIEAEDETVRKVFLKRLELCRNLYVFVLETKTKEPPPNR